MYRFRFVGWLTLSTYRPLILTIGEALFDLVYFFIIHDVRIAFIKIKFSLESDRSPPSISF